MNTFDIGIRPNKNEYTIEYVSFVDNFLSL